MLQKAAPDSPRRSWTALRDVIAIFVVIAALVASLAGASRLSSSVDTRVYFSKSNDHYKQLEAFEGKYVQTNSVVALLHQKTAADRPELVQALRDFHDQAERLPGVLRVESLVNYPFIVPDSGQVNVIPFLDYACTDASCGKFNQIFDEPGVVNRYISKSGDVVSVLMTFRLPVASPTAISTTTDNVRDVAKRVEKAHPNTEVFFVGSITQMDAFRQASRRETFRLIGAAIAIVFTILVFLNREFVIPTFLLLLGAASSILAVGVLGWLGVPLNTSTTAAPVIIFLLVIASSVHVLHGYKEMFYELPDLTARARMQHALRVNRVPMFLTALTTCLALLSMNLADAPPLRQLGNIVCVGFVLGLLVLNVIAPTLAPILKVKRRSRDIHSKLFAYRARHSGVCFTGVVLLAIVSSAGLLRLTVDEDFIRYFSTEYEFRRGADFTEDHFSGPKALNIDVMSGSPGGIETVEFQTTLKRLVDWLRQDPDVGSVASISDAVQKLNEVLNNNSTALNDSDVAQLLFAYELSLGKGQDLNEYIDIDRSSTRVVALLNRLTSRGIIDLDKAIQSWFHQNAPKGYQVSVTGINVPVAYMAVENIRMMTGSIAASILLIAILIGVWFRSAYLAVVAFLAIALPVAMGFGLWGWIQVDIGLAASVILAIAIGIVIDDVIYILGRHNYFVTAGYEPHEAVEKALDRVGSAITQTSVALAIGFSVLTVSGFEINRSLGLCTAMIFVCAWLFDVLLLPYLLEHQPKRKERLREVLES